MLSEAWLEELLTDPERSPTMARPPEEDTRTPGCWWLDR
jgi:hypothetical protein